MNKLLFVTIFYVNCDLLFAEAFNYKRNYQMLDTYEYELSAIEFENGEWNSTSIARSRHMVLPSFEPRERYSWISASYESRRNGIKDFDRIASMVPDHEISLAPKGKIDLPELMSCELIGPMTDLPTFYVAISPGQGVSRLRDVGDVAINDPVIGNHSSAKCEIVGKSCIASKLKLVGLSDSVASLTTEFYGPQDECEGMDFEKEFMRVPVEENKANNFKIVRAVGDKYMVMWGREIISIDSKIERLTGKIRSASMSNRLNLKMKFNCDQNLENCQEYQGNDTFPYNLKRRVSLLIKKD